MITEFKWPGWPQLLPLALLPVLIPALAVAKLLDAVLEGRRIRKRKRIQQLQWDIRIATSRIKRLEAELDELDGHCRRSGKRTMNPDDATFRLGSRPF